MKISKIVLLIVLLIIFGICGIIVSYNKNDNSIQDNNYVKKKHNEKEKCVAFTGGGFNIKFYTDGGIEIPDMHVCIACSPDSYSDLSVPVRDGYNFDGWYYDKEFTKKVEITNTRDFTPVPEYDINKCLIGYKDIEIYAKWSEVQPRMEENIDSNKVTNYSRNNNSNSNINNEPTINNNNDTPTVNNTRVYKPSDVGVVVSWYGWRDGVPYPYLKMKTYNGLLYPINDCEVLRWSFSGNSSQYKYVLYKTKINNEDYFVMYYTYSDLIPIKDFYSSGLINRNVSYSEPLIRLDNRVASSFDYGGYYRIKIARVFTGDYDYAVRMMFQNNFSIPVINPAEVLGLNTLEGFSER